MRQQGLRHGGGIQRRASGVRLTVSFLSGAIEGMWPKGCGDVFGQRFVRVSSCATLGLTQRGFIGAFGPLGMQCEARQFVYRALYRVHLDEPALMSILDGVNHGLPLGAEQFRGGAGGWAARGTINKGARSSLRKRHCRDSWD